MLLKIQPLSKSVRDLYASHGHYHPGDSGLDLFVAETQEIKAGETAFVKLGIKVAAFTSDEEGHRAASSRNPQQHMLRGVSWLLMPRSSIVKTPLRLANSIGLIDAGYRGEVVAVVDNVKNENFTVKKGDRIVQAVAFTGEPLSYQLVDELDSTARGENGFGSTS